VTYFDSERGKHAFKYAIRNPLPLLINAEAGAIINSIRSSLDILAVTLAKRHGATNVKDVSFPVSASASMFAHSGAKNIKRLSAKDRSTIEGFAPYKGGNDALYALHQICSIEMPSGGGKRRHMPTSPALGSASDTLSPQWAERGSPRPAAGIAARTLEKSPIHR
jgi:hypothetical protein